MVLLVLISDNAVSSGSSRCERNLWTSGPTSKFKCQIKAQEHLEKLGYVSLSENKQNITGHILISEKDLCVVSGFGCSAWGQWREGDCGISWTQGELASVPSLLIRSNQYCLSD